MSISVRPKQRVVKSRGQLRDDMHARQDSHDEAALDEALAESFPASDPVAVSISTAAPGEKPGVARSSEPPD